MNATMVNLTVVLLTLALSLVAVASVGAAKPTVVTAPASPNHFQRIASLGIVSDAALAALCEPSRVIAVSAWSTGPVARQWAGKPRLSGLDDLESIIALHPDLVLVSTSGSEADRLMRLRAAGLRVEALGPMYGLTTYTDNLAHIGELLGRGDEARLLGRRLRERLARVADPAAVPPRALYLATFSGTLFGGTTGTSYHDVLVAAGCVDVAAEHYTGWPQFGIEQVLALAPAVIVTKRGMADTLRHLPGMDAVHAARFIELEGDLLEDPGPRLLEAAEALHEQLAEARPADPSTATGH